MEKLFAPAIVEALRRQRMNEHLLVSRPENSVPDGSPPLLRSTIGLVNTVEPMSNRGWPSTLFRSQSSENSPAKVAPHARQAVLQMARVAVSQELFEQVLERILALARGDCDLQRLGLGSFAYAQVGLCLPTASRPSELTYCHPHVRGKPPQRWFS